MRAVKMWCPVERRAVWSVSAHRNDGTLCVAEDYTFREAVEALEVMLCR